MRYNCECKFVGFFTVLFFSILSITTAGAQEVLTLVDTLFASGDISLDARGDIYVADFGDFLSGGGGTNIYKVLRDGSYSVYATGLNGASGNDFDSQGNLFQSNISAGKVSKIDTAGNVNDFASANIFFPVGLVVGDGDTVYVTNCINGPGRITKITPDGISSFFVTDSRLQCPNGLTMDNDGNLYTCNFANGWVVKITPEGIVSNFAFIPGNNNGHLTFANDRLYVVARCNNQVYEVSLDGEVDTLAGSGLRGNDDGPALEATFSLPNGIAASPDGDTLYINDDLNLSGTCNGTPLNPVAVRMIVGVNSSPTGLGLSNETTPVRFELEQNYPNPFNPSTTIRFRLPSAQEVQLKVYDAAGQEVATLIEGRKSAGSHAVEFDAAGLASGIYLYRLTAGSFKETRKMMVVR